MKLLWILFTGKITSISTKTIKNKFNANGYVIINIIFTNTTHMLYECFVKGKEIVKKLEDEGWKIRNISGSHFIMIKDGFRPVPVPCHGKDIKTGLLKAIAKQTGIKLP
jgi:predicted RNA binding protein YcfA (HicA-like mRNA interferase family)